MSQKVLIVDDEENIVELIKFNLELAGFNTKTCYDGKNALEEIPKFMPDLILLDVMLPIIDGITIVQMVRADESLSHIPIIMMTAKNQDADKFLGFESGADDYITKPFVIKELIYRVKAILKRTKHIQVEQIKPKDTKIYYKDIAFDFENYQIFLRGEKCDLTLKEYELIKFLVENNNKVLKRDQLLDKVWGYEYFGESRTLDVHIRNLRKKLEDNEQELIETIRGVGFRCSL